MKDFADNPLSPGLLVRARRPAGLIVSRRAAVFPHPDTPLSLGDPLSLNQ